jgi:hypothetical protein
VAHACDIVDPGQIVSTVGTLLFSWAAGVSIGPLLGAVAMDLVGPGGLFIYSAIIAFGLMAFILYRIWHQPRPAAQGGFMDVSPTGSIIAVETLMEQKSADASGPFQSETAGNDAGRVS